MLSTVYATDEDLLAVAGSDFGLLLPASTDLASGDDGVCEGWTLTGHSFAGVKPAHVCLLTLPAATRPDEWSTEGEYFVIDDVGDSFTSLTLRRLRLSAGQGVPPAPSSSLTAVTYSIRTLDGLIEEASFEINRRFNIDSTVPGRSPTDLKDLRDLRSVTVDLVLSTAYFDAIRAPGDVYAMKYGLVMNRLNERLARLGVRWASPAEPDTRTVFGMRLSR